MDMRQYRVIGAATYLDRAGNVRHITINLTIEAPDAHTAAILMLAGIEIRKGADADYDPQARWEIGHPPIVEDETAKQELIAATGLAVGMAVLHKSGGSTKRGADARRGIVQRIYTVTKQHKIAVRVSVDWPAPNRINGDGWHRSDVLASAIIPATDEEIQRRRAINRSINERNQAHYRAQAAAIDAELAGQGLRLAHGDESRAPQAINVRLSNGCNVWALPK
jgi:hypothetical protein